VPLLLAPFVAALSGAVHDRAAAFARRDATLFWNRIATSWALRIQVFDLLLTNDLLRFIGMSDMELVTVVALVSNDELSDPDAHFLRSRLLAAPVRISNLAMASS
jgi:hypothetical protein